MTEEQRYAKGGWLPADDRVESFSLDPDECIIRPPDDDDATLAPCVRRDTAHQGLCPGGLTVPSRRAAFGLPRVSPEGAAK